MGSGRASDEAQIRELMDAWAEAMRAKDVDAVMSHFAADIVTFDLAPPLQCAGADALRRSLGSLVSHVPRSGRLRGARPDHHDRRRRSLLPQPEPDQRHQNGRRENRRLGARDRRPPPDRRQVAGHARALVGALLHGRQLPRGGRSQAVALWWRGGAGSDPPGPPHASFPQTARSRFDEALSRPRGVQPRRPYRAA